MKAKIINKSLLVAGLLNGLISTSIYAAEEAMSFSFETIPDVSIVQTQALDFGSDLAVASNTICTLVVDETVANRPGSLDARQGLATEADEGPNYQSRTGDCDPSLKGTVGIYAITGAPAVDVTITLNSITPAADTDFSFVPNGVVVDYDTGSAVDALTPIGADTGVDEITLADSTDVSASGSGISGRTLLFVGGTLTAQRRLDAGETYDTQTYVIDVVY